MNDFSWIFDSRKLARACYNTFMTTPEFQYLETIIQDNFIGDEEIIEFIMIPRPDFYCEKYGHYWNWLKWTEYEDVHDWASIMLGRIDPN